MLFIGGHSRSGSTLLSRLLGERGTVASLGELIFVGDRGFKENQLCSCGAPFRECVFWSEVVGMVGGASPERWFTQMARLRTRLARIRFVPGLALQGERSWGGELAAERERYTRMVGEVALAAAAVAGARAVIDSSKHPPYGFLLSRCDRLDVHPLHLVRDARAVAFSQQRRMVRPEVHWKTEMMPRYSPTKTALDWSLYNQLMQLLGRVTGRYRRVRYEDLVESPESVCTALLEWFGHAQPQPARTPDGAALIGHELSGNPMRLQREFKVVADTEWSLRMPARDRAVATAIGAPLLLSYGYRLSARSR